MLVFPNLNGIFPFIFQEILLYSAKNAWRHNVPSIFANQLSVNSSVNYRSNSMVISNLALQNRTHYMLLKRFFIIHALLTNFGEAPNNSQSLSHSSNSSHSPQQLWQRQAYFVYVP